MKFKRLNAYMRSLEDEQTPSLYMAFCAIETLFYDLEDESDMNDADITKLEQGDPDRMPSKLLFVIRTLGSIYRNNVEDMTSRPSFLEEKIAELSAAENKLAEIAADIENRSKQRDEKTNKNRQLKKQLDEKERALSDADEIEQEFSLLTEKLKKSEEKLASLGNHDLEEIKNKLAETERSIEDAEKNNAEYERLRYEAAQKQTRLESQKADIKKSQEEYQQLFEQVKKAEYELKELGAPDVEGMREKLEQTKTAVEKTRKDKEETDRLIAEADTAKDELSGLLSLAEQEKQKYNKLNGELAEIQQELEKMLGSPDHNTARSNLDELSQRNEKNKEEIEECRLLKKQALKTISELEASTVQAENDKAEYEKLNVEIESAKQRLAAVGEFDVEKERSLLAEIKEKEETANSKRAEYSSLMEKRNDLIKSITDLDQNTNEIKNSISVKNEMIEIRKQEFEKLKESENALMSELDDLQNAIFDLENTSLPENKRAIEDADRKKERLANEMNTLVERRQKAEQEEKELTDKIGDERIKVNKKEDEVKEFRNQLEILSSKVSARSERIRELKSQIEELQKTNIEDQKQTILLQHESELQRLNKLRNEVNALQSEIKAMNQEKLMLESKQTEAANDLDNLRKELADLSPLTEEPRKSEIKRTKEYFRFINSVYGEFSNNANRITAALNRPDLSGKPDSFEKFDKVIKALSEYTDSLYKQLDELGEYIIKNIGIYDILNK